MATESGACEGLDRRLLRYSSTLAEPLCTVWGLYVYRIWAPLNGLFTKDSPVVDIAKRIASVAALGAFGCGLWAAPLPVLGATLGTTAFCGLGSKVLRAVGFALQKEGYTHVRGKAAEKTLESNSAKVMTWNVLGIGAGLHFDHGGVLDWRDRLDKIIEKIETEDPDVLVLQEIYDTAFAEALVERLQGRFAHFYLHLGANTWGSVGGGMVLSKCAASRFSNHSFNNNHWTLNRTFTILDVKANPGADQACLRVIGTHLIHDDNAKRLDQVAQITAQVAKEKLALPTLVMGDLNLERDNANEGRRLLPQFQFAYTGSAPTCTNKLLEKWSGKPEDPDQNIDNILLFRKTDSLPVVENGITMTDTHLVNAFENDPRTALSDHHGIATTVRGLY